ncbi:unnamed protein product, partial [Laminaria digitata]
MAATAAAAARDGGGSGGIVGESSAAMFRRLTAEHSVPKRRLFSLLARVRGAVAWGGGLETRRAAVRRRIMALTALVYCHPSEEAVMAYISIQPELVQELVDLVRVRTDKSAQMTVPLDISVLAVHCLSALVHSRDGDSNLGLVARHTNVFQELGITRGQYTGLLPLLVRHGVASLYIMPDAADAAAAAAAAAEVASKAEAGGRRGGGPDESGGWVESKASEPGDASSAAPPPPRPDAALSLGMAFIEAAGAQTNARRGGGGGGAGASGAAGGEVSTSEAASAGAGAGTGVAQGVLSEMDQIRWVEAVFSLVAAVVGVQHGAAAMTECGLIPALLNVVQLNMDGQ